MSLVFTFGTVYFAIMLFTLQTKDRVCEETKSRTSLVLWKTRSVREGRVRSFTKMLIITEHKEMSRERDRLLFNRLQKKRRLSIRVFVFHVKWVRETLTKKMASLDNVWALAPRKSISQSSHKFSS